MKYLLVLLLILIGSCEVKSKYPEGGFEYPKQIAYSDTNFYFFQLKNIASQKECFYHSYDYLFYRPFNEPNLSIKPQPKETFRLTYSAVFRNSIIITFNEDSLTIKKGTPGILYTTDTSRLSDIENYHLRQLQMRFPIDTIGKPASLKRFLDSLIKLYPQLLDPNYYHKLYDKTLVFSKEKFSPTVIKFSITKQQYLSIIQQINSSGFWAMPYQKECEYPSADGYGFTFEANTEKKYKFVSVTGCPEDTTKFIKACQAIVKMANLDKEINLIWSEKMVADSVELPSIKKK